MPIWWLFDLGSAVQDEPKQYRTEESMITVFLHYTVILHVPLLLVVKPIFTALSSNEAFCLLSAVFLPVPVEEIGTLWSSWRWGLQTCWAPASPHCSGTAGCLGDRPQSHRRRPPPPRYDGAPGSHTGTAAHGTSTHTHTQIRHIQSYIILSQRDIMTNKWDD